MNERDVAYWFWGAKADLQRRPPLGPSLGARAAAGDERDRAGHSA
jgi:hypothetical protein